MAAVEGGAPGRRLVGNLRLELFVGLGMKAAGAGSSFLLTWLIARGFGADTVGRFQIALTTSSILSVWTGLAMDNIMLRSVAPALHERRLCDVRASFVKALSVAGLATGAAALALFLGAPAFAARLLEAPGVTGFLRVLAPVIFLLAIIRVSAALIRAQGSLLVSQSLDGIGYTTIAVALLGVAWVANVSHWPLIVPTVYAVGVAAVAVVGLSLAWRSVRSWPRGTANVPVAAGAVVACVYVTAHLADWTSLLIITRNLGTSGAGIYRVSFQVCLLFAIVNTAFNAMMTPHLAAATARMDRPGFRRVIRTSSLTGLAICAPLFVVIMVGAEHILAIFGPEFVAGGMALRILAVAQLIGVATGPIGTALMMMHREKTMLSIEIAATVLSILTAFLVIPHYGIIGASMSALVASVTRELSTLVAVHFAMRAADAGTAPAAA